MIIAIGTMAVNTAAIASTTGGPDEQDLGDLPQYSRLFGVSVEEARQEVALADEARVLQDEIAAAYGDHFAGMWLEHEPRFRIVVAVTVQDPQRLSSLITPGLAPYVRMEVVSHSLSELSAITENLSLDLPHAYGLDVKNNEVSVSVLATDAEGAEAWVREHVSGDAVRIRAVTSLPRPIANIYGGLQVDGHARPLDLGHLAGRFASHSAH